MTPAGLYAAVAQTLVTTPNTLHQRILAEKYVAAAYGVVFVAVLAYVLIIASKLQRLQRQVGELVEQARERAVEDGGSRPRGRGDPPRVEQARDRAVEDRGGG